MKHTQADKYTIAWFKIAECVSRGEKERALGVYRLLSHSFNDDAVARQLEADIYLSCNEQERAIFLYKQAVELYKKSERFMEAAAISEHLILLLPHDLSVRQDIIFCYHMVGLMNKVSAHSQLLLDRYVHDNKRQDIERFMQEVYKSFNVVTQVIMCQYISALVHKRADYVSIVMICIEKTMAGLLLEGHEQVLQEFLAKMKVINEELYHYALDCIEK